MHIDRRTFLEALGVGAAVIALPIPQASEDARYQARLAGFDPDEIVAYGPPASRGDGDPIEREAPAWMLFDEGYRVRLS